MTALPTVVGQRVLVTFPTESRWDPAPWQWCQVERSQDNGPDRVELRVVHDSERTEDGQLWTMFADDPSWVSWQPMPVCPECGPSCADLVNEVAA